MKRRSFLTGLVALPAIKVLDELVPKELRIFASNYDDKSKKSLPTGFSAIDELTGGFHSGEVTILAASPAIGKSAFAINLSNYLSIKNTYKVVYFSIEMSKELLTKRLLALNTKISTQQLQVGKLCDDAWPRMIEGALAIASSNFIVCDQPSISASEIEEKISNLTETEHPDLIIVDYLQLMRSNQKTKTRAEEINNILKDLKLLAVKLNTPVLVLAQSNRPPKAREDKQPRLTDIREAPQVIDHADVVMMLYRGDNYKNLKSNTNNILEVHINQNRNGNVGMVKLAWLPTYGGIENV